MPRKLFFNCSIRWGLLINDIFDDEVSKLLLLLFVGLLNQALRCRLLETLGFFHLLICHDPQRIELTWRIFFGVEISNDLDILRELPGVHFGVIVVLGALEDRLVVVYKRLTE